MTETQTIRIDPDVPEGHCGVCRREIGEDEERLSVMGTHGETLMSVTVCRSCLSEHIPGMLAAIEEHVEEE